MHCLPLVYFSYFIYYADSSMDVRARIIWPWQNPQYWPILAQSVAKKNFRQDKSSQKIVGMAAMLDLAPLDSSKNIDILTDFTSFLRKSCGGRKRVYFHYNHWLGFQLLATPSLKSCTHETEVGKWWSSAIPMTDYILCLLCFSQFLYQEFIYKIS